MGANTKIEWCDHTFSPWRGCQKVAAGCANCYAESQAKRNTKTLGVWGPNGTRVVAAEAAWERVLRWDLASAIDGESRSVFCGSMCDVFEDWPGQCKMSDGGWCAQHRKWGQPTGYGSCSMSGGNDAVGLPTVRARLFRLIDATRLTWLLLTKRPENIRSMIPAYFPGGYIAEAGAMNQEGPRDNLWLGTSIACQEDADRNIPELLKCHDLCVGLFLSIEPLIGPVDLRDLCVHESRETYGLGGPYMSPPHAGIDQVIIGGESGPHARPCNVDWIRSIAHQCEAAGVGCFVKQLGAFVLDNDGVSRCSWPGLTQFVQVTEGCKVRLRDKKGGDPDEWPEDLRQYRILAWKGGA